MSNQSNTPETLGFTGALISLGFLTGIIAIIGLIIGLDIETMKVIAPVVALIIIFAILVAKHIIEIKEADELVKQVDLGIKEGTLIPFPTSIANKNFQTVKHGVKHRVFKVEDEVHVKKVYASELDNANLKALSDYLEELKISSYAFVDISRSTYSNIDTGTYIYTFDHNKNLYLVQSPITIITSPSKKNLETGEMTYYNFSVYDSKKEKKVLKIDFDQIKDFQVHGFEHLASTVSSNNEKAKPSIIKTGLSEMLFGTSFTLLKGLSKASINTKHEIKDMRVVQVILTDSTDLEFQGMSIYYDFNRVMGSVKNKATKDSKNTTSVDTTDSKSNQKNQYDVESKISLENSNIAFTNEHNIEEKIRQYKKMLDEGLIDESEFKELKKKAIDKS